MKWKPHTAFEVGPRYQVVTPRHLDRILLSAEQQACVVVYDGQTLVTLQPKVTNDARDRD